MPLILELDTIAKMDSFASPQSNPLQEKQASLDQRLLCQELSGAPETFSIMSTVSLPLMPHWRCSMTWGAYGKSVDLASITSTRAIN